MVEKFEDGYEHVCLGGWMLQLGEFIMGNPDKALSTLIAHQNGKYILMDFDALKNRLKEKGAKYYDEPYLRFKGTKYEQETFFVKDPNENILEIKTLTANAE